MDVMPDIRLPMDYANATLVCLAMETGINNICQLVDGRSFIELAAVGTHVPLPKIVDKKEDHITQINLIPSRFILLYRVRSVMRSASAVLRRLKLVLCRH